MITQNIYVGIDVSKLRLDVHIRPCNESFSVANTKSGIEELGERLQSFNVLGVGLEASGGYERDATSALASGGYKVHLLNPAQVRSFARAMKINAKTDPIDAILIARYIEAAAETLIQHQPDATRDSIADLAMYRRKLIEESKGLKALLGTVRNPCVRQSVELRLVAIKNEVSVLQHEIKAYINTSPQLKATAENLLGVPGVGPVLASTLVADLPELGHTSAKRIASLVGVAPHSRQSGQRDRGGKCSGGRKSVRDVLYMATLSAIKAKQQHLAPFYQRLRAAGKPFKKALLATMRKFITILNAISRDQTEFRSKHP
jgi:transposase